MTGQRSFRIESRTIDDGAVAPWNSLMWSLMTDVCRAMGVRTDVPFRELTDAEKEIVYNGPAEKKHIFYHSKNTNQAGELDFTYYNAVYTVENALAKVKDEQGMKRVERFLKQEACPDCGGTRLSERGKNAGSARDYPGPGLHDDACRTRSLGGRRSGFPAGSDAPHGDKHLRIVPGSCKTTDGSRTGIPGTRPRSFHSFYR
ncbi:MAG: hypothetical protein V8T10_04550 [Merdibacter sp.]